MLLKITGNKKKKRIHKSKHSNRSKNLLYRSHRTGCQIFNCCNECSFTRKFFSRRIADLFRKQRANIYSENNKKSEYK